MSEVAVPDLSPAAAAEMLGVHVDTVKRWAKTGELRSFRTPGGWWRFRRVDIETFIEERYHQNSPGPQAAAL